MGGGLLLWSFSGMTPAEIPFTREICPVVSLMPHYFCTKCFTSLADSIKGTAAPGGRLRIYDHERKQIAEKDQAGEMHFCAPSIIKNYLGNRNQDAFYDDDGGTWFKTGDLGLINGNGVAYVLGRIKDTIKRAGIPITPAALESCIDRFTGCQVRVVFSISSITNDYSEIRILLIERHRLL